MPDLQSQIAALRDPHAIRKAGLASSPYVLRKIIAQDEAVRRLIAAGRNVVPVIEAELAKKDTPDAITLATYAYVVEHVDPAAAPRVLGGLFKDSLEHPDVFFVFFATNALRAAFHLPLKPLKMNYTRAEMIETRELLH